MKLKIGNSIIENNTHIGIVKNMFKNEQELENMLPGKVHDIQTFLKN